MTYSNLVTTELCVKINAMNVFTSVKGNWSGTKICLTLLHIFYLGRTLILFLSPEPIVDDVRERHIPETTQRKDHFMAKIEKFNTSNNWIDCDHL